MWSALLSSRDSYLDRIAFLPALDRERELFADEFVRSAERRSHPFHKFECYYDKAPASDQLSRLMYLDIKTYLTADILTKVDRMSMVNSLEVRCPILDHVFVEWVSSLPLKYKFRNGTRKFILKKLAERLGIPRRLLERRKQGFALPLVHWMRHELKNTLYDILLDSKTLQRGYFKPPAVRNLLDAHYRGPTDYSGILWMLMVFELWHRNFLTQ